MFTQRRRRGQSFWIGKEIQIIVVGHFNGITHIGIEATSDLEILADELKDRELVNQDD